MKDGVIERTLKALKHNDFDARFAASADEAKKMVLDTIPVTARIGVGDSATLRQLGVLDELARRGNEVINPFLRELTQTEDPVVIERFYSISRTTFGSDVFVASSNALTEDGKVVNIDGVGGRVSGMVFAAPKTILVVGRNKIVKDAESAVRRIKDVIAPAHMKHKEKKTPCAKTGVCSDCNAPERGCNVTVIIEKRPRRTEFTVVLVDEDLGLGWDPAWDKRRIDAIHANYRKQAWPFWMKPH